MKLARVEHDRCGEWAATTFLMVPDELTEEEFRLAIRRARDSYDADARAFLESKSAPSYPYAQDYEKYPDDMTMKEVRQAREDKKREYKEWEERRSRASQSFGTYLLREIEGSQNLHEAPALEGSVNWGHQHGRSIDYGDKADKDLRGVHKFPQI